MSPEEPKSSPFPPHANDCLSHFLTLLDGACKRYSVDVYNAQMANIRSHLWLAFVVLSACAAFFVQADIGGMLMRSLRANQFNPFILTTVFSLLFAVACAMEALWLGIEASTGTTVKEAYNDIDQQLTTFENRGYLAEDVYRLKRTVLFDVYTQMQAANVRMNERGLLIRSMSKQIKHSIILGSVAVLSFLLTQPFL